MFKNYLTSALRFLKRNKLFAGINIIGLSLALAVSFIILLFVVNEFSYDKGYNKRKQIYRVILTYSNLKITQPLVPYILTSEMKSSFPQVEYAAPIRYVRPFQLKKNDEFISIRSAASTVSDFFNIFDISLTGTKENILDDPNSIVLSKKQAEKFFPDENPVGKEIMGSVLGKEQLFVVKGVFDDFPANSSIQADCFVNTKWSLDQINQSQKIADADINWKAFNWNTWVLLKENTDTAAIIEQFRTIAARNYEEYFYLTFSLQSLSDVYFHSAGMVNAGKIGNMKKIKIFSAIAFLIIVMAAFNYIILSTAVSSGRSKEIAMRKMNGASIKSIKKQMLGESVFLLLIVLPIAVGFALLVKPYAEELFQMKLHIIHSNLVTYILIYLLLTLVIGLFSGLYTSTYLSSLNVIGILKNGTVSGKGKPFLRSALITVQLVIFCSFISGTLIIRSQYKYALNKDLGYQNNNILLVDMGRDFKEYKAFINSVNSIPEVKSAAGTLDALPAFGSTIGGTPNFKDPSKIVEMEGLFVHYNFIETMGIKVLKGRSFSEEFGSDLKNSVLINEKAVKDLGIEDPIGKLLEGRTIIGIVNDFNLHTIRTDIPPLSIYLYDRYYHMAVNYAPGKLDVLLPKIEKEWKAIAPNRPFQYKTIEDVIEGIYDSEKNLSVIVSISALFSLLIAAFGLFALTLFIAKTRTKEIGIKKVFGSTEKSIIYSFLKENLIMVVVASILAIPITYYFMNRWLSNFSYNVGINFWFFVVAFFIAMLVVLLTVLFHSFRASRTNPVEALRYE
ncbi:MAG: ABC transporter permease [Mariniphaga sp.]|nr:ABC transporter permease [Mariniphaga sp.]